VALRSTPNGYDPYEVASALQKSIRRGREYDAFWWAHELAINQTVVWLWNRLEVIACEDIGMGNPQAIVIVHSCREAWENVNDKRAVDQWEWSLLAQPIIMMCRSPKSRSADDLSHLVWLRKDGRDPITREVDSSLAKERLPIPPEAYDMHTKAGKAQLIAAALEAGQDPEALMTRNFREVGGRLDRPCRDVANDGTNWTEEVCKLQNSDAAVALAPLNIVITTDK
jgi:hypothetical protein